MMTQDDDFSGDRILEALRLIYAADGSNDTRRTASEYLERLKDNHENALRWGFLLSTDISQAAQAQHYGLSLISHVIRHQTHHLFEEQSTQLRAGVLDLARSLTADQPAFIRNKVAELWIELAKQSWALDWFDMDTHLVQLWSRELVHKNLVLTILESLSEDVFAREDSIAVLRGNDLNSSLVEIFTPRADYLGGLVVAGRRYHMRYGEEGWLTRIAVFINEAPKDISLNAQLKDVFLKALATLRSVFVWAMIPAIHRSKAYYATTRFLHSRDPDAVIASLDAMIAFYGRAQFSELEVQQLVLPNMVPRNVEELSKLYQWSVVPVEELDSAKYVVSKKLSELLSLTSDHLGQHATLAANKFDVTPFLHLLTAVAQHESLIVSIPVIHSWYKMLEVRSWRELPLFWECVTQLVPVVSERLVLYDQYPETFQSPVVAFLNEEIELFPERQGFYQNYRRLCSAIIEWICFSIPEQAMPSILGRVDANLDEIESAEQNLTVAEYERLSMRVLSADAAFSLVDAAFRGFDRFQQEGPSETSEQEELQHTIRRDSKGWMLNMLSKRDFRDPQIKQRRIRSAVDASFRMLQKDTEYAFKVLEHILSSFITTPQEDPVYAEAVDELHNFATAELRRLSLQHADYFVTFYDQLEAKFSDLVAQLGANERLQIDLKSILFSVVQRATTVADAPRRAKLEGFLQTIATAWADEGLQEILGSLEAFAHSQAFDQIGPYMMSLQAGRIEDWSQVQYDDTGSQIQHAMTSGYSKLPLRETRILLSISTERLQQDSNSHKMICELWAPLVPSILEYVLRLTSYNHQLHNPSSWPNLAPEAEAIIRRVLRDRYWQSGISTGSMGDFHTKVRSTKSTLEGFASSVRGRIRSNLEQCYSILHTLGRLGPALYNIQQLPQMIAEAAIDTSTPLSPHHFSVVIQMLPKLIDECTPESRQHFLTPVLSSLLVQMEKKLTEEWAKIGQIKQTKHDDENLNDEMRDDSVLRQTTYKAVNLVSNWLNPKRELQLSTKKSIVNGNYLTLDNIPTLRDFLLSNIQVLDKLLVFMTRALGFQDMKSSHTLIMAMQSLVVEFTTERFLPNEHAAAVREFFSEQVLMKAIDCLHDGYFADHQQYYAHLIATIWLSYGLPISVPATQETPEHHRPPLTSKPQEVILSLPGMTKSKVNEAAERLMKEGSGGGRSKKLRAIILSLLEGVRGVRVSELGKLDTKHQQNKMLERYKERDMVFYQGVSETQQINVGRIPQPEYHGIQNLFEA